MEKVLAGTIICPGIAFGQAHVLTRKLSVPRTALSPDRVAAESKRYDRAVRLVQEHLHEHVLQAHRDAGLDALKLFNIHELMLGDEEFHQSVRRRIAEQLQGPEWALTEEAERLSGRLEASGDPYLQARVEDIWDMAQNLLAALCLPAARYAAEMRESAENHILVSSNLFLSEAMKARNARARGLVTSSRALTSHAAILLKGFNIPSLGAVRGLAEGVRPGDELILDALKGRLIVRPSQETTQSYEALRRAPATRRRKLPAAAVETRTADGTRVTLLANIDNAGQVELLLDNRLEGIGLFRTEFLLLGTERIPDEQEQYLVYRRVMERMRDRRVVMRSFDLGADKRLPYLERCLAQNPSLGIRGIRRHLLRRPEELRTQLRAILRAAKGASIDILIPMVTTLADMAWVREVLAEVMGELAASGTPFCESPRLGAMIEIPAAAFSVQSILPAVDFVSLGTNDLIQYFTAADRDNEAVQRYGDLRNEAVLFMMRHVADAAKGMGRIADVSICGEAASVPENVPLLLEMGYRSLSISPVAADPIRAAVRGTRL
ncbi:MAG: phosphoenolpyruvate--protein phosphotransferase [Spirochaetales bacterium]|nr:phosphoenolpyruvate--protein phosphotransferase [Spirochaetales bacterium]